MLARQEFGAGDGPPLVIAHGLFGSARNWRAIARALGRHRRVVALDMRNHGASFHAPGQSYAEMAGDLARVIAAKGGRADLMGHSMGGKAAMVLALTRPELVRRLIVADIAPVAYNHSHIDQIEAMRGLDLRGITRRSEADARLAAVVPDAAVRAFLLQSLDLGEGGPRWTLNLDALARAMPELVGWPEIPGRFDGPALFLRGADSDYVRREHEAVIRALFPAATIETLPGAGHWLHAEKSREFIAAVERFLD
ncbi:MAG: alpha/beta fold hydrolase [Alphaproteobacteria bacterium]|nr:MAG: alpha/beta fold hydrolase [Alphaproteobacteria bacterium]